MHDFFSPGSMPFSWGHVAGTLLNSVGSVHAQCGEDRVAEFWWQSRAFTALVEVERSSVLACIKQHAFLNLQGCEVFALKHCLWPRI